jgi:photosystem II stability/assembly factor-like uncharacterized protein
MNRSWIAAISVAAVAVGVVSCGPSGSNPMSSGAPIKVRTITGSRDMTVAISPQGNAPVTVRHVLINDKTGVHDCDLNLENGVHDYDDNNEVFLTGNPVLSLGNEFIVDLSIGGACGTVIAKLHVETDQGSADFDIP